MRENYSPKDLLLYQSKSQQRQYVVYYYYYLLKWSKSSTEGEELVLLSCTWIELN